ERVEDRPQRLRRVDHPDADGRSFRPGLEYPRTGHVVQVVTDIVVIEHGNEIGHADFVFERLHAHGELVSKITHRRKAHTGDAHVLAQGGGGFHVELVERDDAVNLLVPRHVSYRFYNLRDGQLGGNVEDVVQALARPIGVTEFLGCKQEHATALAFAFAHEFLSLFVGADAEKGERRGFRHAGLPIQGKDYTTGQRVKRQLRK